MGFGAELAPYVCSGHWLRQEGTCATGQWVFLCPWIPGGPSNSRFGADARTSSPIVLGMLEYLGVQLPLVVVQMGTELVPKVSRYYLLKQVRQGQVPQSYLVMST